MFFFIFISFLNARDWRVLQIPNGSKFTCSNCHIDPFGGGIRNKFGQAVEKLVSVGGHEEFWGPVLAKLDSDGDGKTNGQELGDSNGLWRSGQQNPGIFNSVTNPGDPTSFTLVGNFSGLPTEYKLYNNYPNPFNPITTIKYSIPLGTKGISYLQHVSLKVYDMLGRIVTTLVNDIKQAGTYEVRFDGSKIASGVYIYQLVAGNIFLSNKLILIK